MRDNLHPYLQVTPETKMLNPLICTTRDGVRNIFRDIQVISSLDPGQVLDLVRRYTPKMKHILVYDRVEEAIQLFCANHSIDEVIFISYHSIKLLSFNCCTQTLSRRSGTDSKPTYHFHPLLPRMNYVAWVFGSCVHI